MKVGLENVGLNLEDGRKGNKVSKIENTHTIKNNN